MNHTSCVRGSDLHLTFNQGLCLTLEKSKSLDPAVPDIQRCPVLANRLRVWGALPLTPFGLPVRVWIGSNRSRGIAVNLQKNVFLIIAEFWRNWIMRSKCRVRAGEGTREKGDTTLWLVLTPGWPHTCTPPEDWLQVEWVALSWDRNLE